MTGVTERKGSIHCRSSFSIVKHMLADCAQSFRSDLAGTDERFKDLGYVAVPTTDIEYEQQMVKAIGDDQVSAEEFTRMLRGGHSPIVMGLSTPRITAVVECEEPTTDYQKKVADDTDRVTVGLYYMPLQTWSDADSILTYFGILNGLTPKEFAKEKQCELYQIMLDKAIHLFITEDRAFVVQLKRRGCCPNWLAKKPIADTEMAITLPSGNRVVFDDF